MAKTISDFEKWLREMNFRGEEFEDVYSLHCAIRSGMDYGRFLCKRDPVNGGKLISPTTGGNNLLLVSPAAEAFFLELLTRGFCGDLDMEGWHSLQQNLAKAD